jgi:hypothetical protein
MGPPNKYRPNPFFSIALQATRCVFWSRTSAQKLPAWGRAGVFHAAQAHQPLAALYAAVGNSFR